MPLHRAEALTLVGRADEGYEQLLETLDSTAPLRRRWHGAWAASTALAAAGAAGRDDAVDRLLRIARDSVDACPVWSGTPPAVAHMAVATARAAGASELASPSWLEAIRVCESAGLGPLASTSRFALAGLLISGGKRDDGARDDARALLDEAATYANDIGFAALAVDIADLRRRARLGGSTDENPYGLTERETDVIRLVADGRTNTEIAAELFISPKTASVHVSNLIRKLGVSNRRQVARAVRELGI